LETYLHDWEGCFGGCSFTSLLADLSDLQSASQRAARILWATLQTHRVFDDFIRAEYRHDPRIAPIIVLHLLENRISRVELDTLKNTVATQAMALAKMRKEIDGLTTRLSRVDPKGMKPKPDEKA
jgi:uncharacterized coiled-coil protein SlyX